jgi:outer membrane lipoprotein-sorting protein
MKRALVIILLLSICSAGYTQTATALLYQMMDSARAVKGFKSVISKTERIQGKMITQESLVKVKRNPYLLYVRQLQPKEGVEILCNRECEKALINTNGFPWLNLTLDPFGQLMRKNQHHTVHDTGFDLLVRILESELRIDDANQVLTADPRAVWDNKSVYRVEMLNKDFKYVKYKVRPGEDISHIADRLNVNGYAILEANSECNDYEDVVAGQIIIVPSNYAYKMILLLDKKTMLPVQINVFDDDGLFEEYIYRQFVLNPVFASNEFEADFLEYSF